MSVSRFLTELAERLEEGTLRNSERAKAAFLCRDYAMIALNQEAERDSIELAATNYAGCRIAD